MKILLRLIALPFVIGLQLITYIKDLFQTSYMFLRYGGEFIRYKQHRTTIKDVYDELKVSQREKTNLKRGDLRVYIGKDEKDVEHGDIVRVQSNSVGLLLNTDRRQQPIHVDHLISIDELLNPANADKN